MNKTQVEGTPVCDGRLRRISPHAAFERRWTVFEGHPLLEADDGMQ